MEDKAGYCIYMLEILQFRAFNTNAVPSYNTMKNWCNEFNLGRHSFQDEFPEGCPKLVVVPKNIDGGRETEPFLGISSIIIHSILHAHQGHQEDSRWILHNLTIAQKGLVSIGAKKCLKKCYRGASKDVYKIMTGPNLGSMRMSKKKTINRIVLPR